VGLALINGDRRPFPSSDLILKTWPVGSTPAEAARILGKKWDAQTVVRVEYTLERAVTEYIGKMPFLWVAVDDWMARAHIESNTIALLSNMGRPAGQLIDPATDKWLGRYAVRSEVRNSGLWNVRCVSGVSDPRAMTMLDDCIKTMPRTHSSLSSTE
jgi:hypothetical protein